MQIDLRSDTLTKPSAEMLKAMLSAPLGDDVFGEDPTVKKLEETCAAMFGMEAGLFCPSGTMTNQIAVKAHTQPLDEIICDQLCHIYNYETGGWAFHSGVSVRLTQCERGIMNAEAIAKNILPDYDWYPNSRMVCIENTVNKGGGAVYSIEQMKEIGKFCRAQNLIYHLDGARIFNALAVLKKSPIDLAGMFDSISVCLSKGLGAPAGSVLLGSKNFIKKSRKIRKVMGGGMRQAGIVGAACLYALQHNIDRLSKDHFLAKEIGTTLTTLSYVEEVIPVETNICIFKLKANVMDREYLAYLAANNVHAFAFGENCIRFVTHLDITEEMLPEIKRVLQSYPQ